MRCRIVVKGKVAARGREFNLRALKHYLWAQVSSPKGKGKR